MGTPVENVEKSYGRCSVNPQFLDRFYEIFLASNSSIAPMFKTTNMAQQKALLRQGITMVLMHNKGNSFGTRALDRIGESHNKKKLNINPSMYPFWINSLVSALKECDPEMTPALESEWRKILEAGTAYIAGKWDKV